MYVGQSLATAFTPNVTECRKFEFNSDVSLMQWGHDTW